MRKLLIFLFLFITIGVFGQVLPQPSGTLTVQTTNQAYLRLSDSTYYVYNGTTGKWQYLLTKKQADGLYAPIGGSGGYVPTSRTITINGVTWDLSANRTWNVGITNITGLSDSLLNKANKNFNNVAAGAIANSKLANSTISGVALGSNLSAVTFNSTGTGDASGTTYNGSIARTISYNTVGASVSDNFIHLKDYNPDSTGVTSSNTAFANAIVAAKAKNVSLFIDDGIYKITTSSIIVNDFHRAIFGNNVKIFTTSAIPIFKVSNSDNINISGLWLRGQMSSGQIGMRIVKTSNADVRLRLDSLDYGLYIDSILNNDTTTLKSRYTVNIVDTRTAGIYLGKRAEYQNIVAPVITRGLGYGILVDGPNNNVTAPEITYNNINIQYNGYLTSNSDHGSITGGSINHGVSANVVFNNIHYSMALTGVQIYASENGNYSGTGSSFGVFLNNSHSVSIVGNNIGRNSVNIGIDSSDYNLISANVLLTDEAVTTDHIKEYGSQASHYNIITTNSYYGTKDSLDLLAGSTLSGTVYQHVQSAILKSDSKGKVVAAVAGTDYLAPAGAGFVSSITGTANQVTASASTGAVTLSLPQSIATTSNVEFGAMELNGATNRFLRVGGITTGSSYQEIVNTNVDTYFGNTSTSSGIFTGASNNATVIGNVTNSPFEIFTQNVKRIAITGSGDISLNGTTALGSNSLTMTGSIGATGARATKIWTTDIESTNMPTVGGTSLSSTFALNASPAFTGTVTTPALTVTGLGTFGGGGSSRINIGNAATSASDANIWLRTGSGQYAWLLGAQNNINNAFEITPSTAVGGTTFSTPVFSVTQPGVVTIANLGTGAVQATAGVLSVISDSKAKDLHGKFKGSALTVVSNLNPGQYWNYNKISRLGKNAESVKQFGLLADQVHEKGGDLAEQLAPTQGTYDKNGKFIPTLIDGKPVYGLNTTAIISLLTEAVQELKKEVDMLKK